MLTIENNVIQEYDHFKTLKDLIEFVQVSLSKYQNKDWWLSSMESLSGLSRIASDDPQFRFVREYKDSTREMFMTIVSHHDGKIIRASAPISHAGGITKYIGSYRLREE